MRQAGRPLGAAGDAIGRGGGAATARAALDACDHQIRHTVVWFTRPNPTTGAHRNYQQMVMTIGNRAKLSLFSSDIRF